MTESTTHELIGTSPLVADLRASIQKVALTRSPVLLTGEPGTGKSLVARAIHQLSGLLPAAFVPLKCSELSLQQFQDLTSFGSSRTLFFDEIANLKADLQDRLLRLMNSPDPSAKIIARTNQSLSQQVNPHNFNAALSRLLMTYEIQLQPLRDRREDIPLLATHFLHDYNRRMDRRFTGINENALRCLQLASWKGNVRELRNIIERAVIIGVEPMLNLADLRPVLQPALMPAAETKDLKDAVTAFERDHIRRIIAECKGDKRAAARDLDISLSSLYRHLDLKGPIQ